MPLDCCMQCPREKGVDEYGGWKYFRLDGALTVLCPDCYYTRTGGHVDPVQVIAFMARVRDLCGYPAWASSLIPAKRSPKEWIEYAIANFREMTPDELSEAENDCLRDPAPGKPDERDLRTFDARKVLRCLRIVRKACEGTISKLFRAWDGIDETLDSFMDADQYADYRARLLAFAETEFLFRCGVLLSEEIDIARERAAKKKTVAAKKKIYDKIVASIVGSVPANATPSVREEVERFVDFMNAQVAELRSECE